MRSASSWLEMRASRCSSAKMLRSYRSSLLINQAFVITIAEDYLSRVKNCASDVCLSNLRNPLPVAQAYSYYQNHCSDKQSTTARPIRPAAAATPTGDEIGRASCRERV